MYAHNPLAKSNQMAKNNVNLLRKCIPPIGNRDMTSYMAAGENIKIFGREVRSEQLVVIINLQQLPMLFSTGLGISDILSVGWLTTQINISDVTHIFLIS